MMRPISLAERNLQALRACVDDSCGGRERTARQGRTVAEEASSFLGLNVARTFVSRLTAR
jgi:hypothetical protein